MSRPIIFITPCTHLDLNRLQEEIIVAESDVQATIKVDDNLHVHSILELTQAQKDNVISIIANFVDINPADKIPKIVGLAKAEAKNKHFHNIIYTSRKELITSLIPKRTVVKGEVVQVIWYKDVDLQTQELSNPIVKVDIVYTRDESTSFPLFRDTTRSYYNEDGSLNDESKTGRKYYFINDSDQIDEGHKRRGLLVQSIQKPVMGMMAQVLMPLGYDLTYVMLSGRQFLDDYEEEFDRFVNNSSTVTDPSDPNYGKKTVIVELEEEARVSVVEWIDKSPAALGGSITIRQYLINEFDI